MQSWPCFSSGQYTSPFLRSIIASVSEKQAAPLNADSQRFQTSAMLHCTGSKRGFNSLEVLAPSNSCLLSNLEDALSGKRSRVSSSVSVSEQEELCNPLAVSPELYLKAILQERGYSTARRTSTARGFCHPPSGYEVQLYDLQLVQTVRNNDVRTLAELLTANPESARACNKFGKSTGPHEENLTACHACAVVSDSGLPVLCRCCLTCLVSAGESLVHIACRRASPEMLNLILECGGSLCRCDDMGR